MTALDTRPAGAAVPAAHPAAGVAADPAATPLTVPGDGRPLVRTSRLPASTLLALSARGLLEAQQPGWSPAERYALAHLAALRAAAAVLACRARPAPASTRARPTSAWVLLSGVAPELAEWAGFFAAGAAKRAAAEAGLPAAVTPREADDLLREATAFLGAAEQLLDRPSLDGSGAARTTGGSAGPAGAGP